MPISNIGVRASQLNRQTMLSMPAFAKTVAAGIIITAGFYLIALAAVALGMPPAIAGVRGAQLNC